MRKLTLAFCLGFIALVFSGCDEVDIQDGRIPAQYLDQVRALTGNYIISSGTGFGSAPAHSLSVSLAGDRLVLTARPDLLNPNCHSTIGLLRKARIDEENGQYTVEGGSFYFNPGNCVSVEGKKLDVDLRVRNGSIQLHTSVLEGTDWREECNIECYPVSGGGVQCERRCYMTPYSRYIESTYTKTN